MFVQLVGEKIAGKTRKWKGLQTKQKAFFDKIALDYGFDASTESDKWAYVSRDDVLSRKVCFWGC